MPASVYLCVLMQNGPIVHHSVWEGVFFPHHSGTLGNFWWKWRLSLGVGPGAQKLTYQQPLAVGQEDGARRVLDARAGCDLALTRPLERHITCDGTTALGQSHSLRLQEAETAQSAAGPTTQLPILCPTKGTHHQSHAFMHQGCQSVETPRMFAHIQGCAETKRRARNGEEAPQ